MPCREDGSRRGKQPVAVGSKEEISLSIQTPFATTPYTRGKTKGQTRVRSFLPQNKEKGDNELPALLIALPQRSNNEVCAFLLLVPRSFFAQEGLLQWERTMRSCLPLAPC